MAGTAVCTLQAINSSPHLLQQGSSWGNEKHAAVAKDRTGTAKKKKKKKTWLEAGRLEYAPSKVGSCAAVCDKVQLAVNTLWGSLHSWRP